MIENKALVSFRKSVVITIAITYFLILVGALVRATGSGMGCPDWPKCFGQYIPPTDISELPTNYKEIFKVEGKTIADFNAFHTWVEYLNRLLGVVEGLVILIMCSLAFRLRKEYKKIWISSIFSLLLVLFIGWVGSKVVSSNLAPIKITAHMVLAMFLSFVLIGTYSLTFVNAKIERIKQAKFLFNISLILFILTLVQILSGTQVRQQVDEIAIKLQNTHREVWVENLNLIFDVHKVLASLITVIFIAVYFYFRSKVNEQIKRLLLQNTMIVLIEFLLGNILAFAMPAFAQPFHLLFATILSGSLFYTLVVVNKLR